MENIQADAHASVLKAGNVTVGEISQLKMTVATLHDELERARQERDRAVQGERATAHQEMQQLKATAASLREALELARIDQENAVGREHALFDDESMQLRNTIQMLREQLGTLAHSTEKNGPTKKAG